MKRHMLTCGILALAASVAAAQDKPPTAPASAPGLVPLAVQLEQGIYQEETAGQLEASAKTYSQIASQAEATRALAAQALYRLVVVQTKLKHEAEAKAAAQKLAAMYPEQGDLIAKAQAAVGGAPSLAASNGSALKPEDVWDKSREIHKPEVDALVAKGWQLMQDGKYRDAADAFDKAFQIDSSSTSALDGKGWADFYVPHDDKTPYKAESYFKQALLMNPRDAMALSGLGEYYANYDRNSDLIRAQDFWKAAVEADPTATGPMAKLADSMAQQGLYANAASWYEKWLQQEPQSARAKQGLTKVQETQVAIKAPLAVVEEYPKKLDSGAYREAYDMMDIPAEQPAPTRGGGGRGPRVRGDAVASEPVPQTAPAINPEVAAEVAAKEWLDRNRAQREPLGKVLTRRAGNTMLGVPVPENLNSPYTGLAGGGFGGAQLGYMTEFRSSLIGDQQRLSFPLQQAGIKPLTLTSDALNEVEATYGADFEHQKRAFERIIVKKGTNGRWRISSYTLDSGNWKAIDPLHAQ